MNPKVFKPGVWRFIKTEGVKAGDSFGNDSLVHNISLNELRANREERLPFGHPFRRVAPGPF
jgi:hypothetical protein